MLSYFFTMLVVLAMRRLQVGGADLTCVRSANTSTGAPHTFVRPVARVRSATSVGQLSEGNRHRDGRFYGDHGGRLVLDCGVRLALGSQTGSSKPGNWASHPSTTSAITSKNQACCVLLTDIIEQGRASSSSQDKQKQEDGFTPIFDGLRFIESLVTAHR
ncbi:hypothetical protein B296_00049470 [Ensete ventricosum]|uniref:Secreted protein n=1 Tax=Ensete ventricosum TaxID=4639 RepID=A0A426X201_ENSVE|nr:hypothetical protein B296_00049470 [Ensete ventricosum]